MTVFSTPIRNLANRARVYGRYCQASMGIAVTKSRHSINPSPVVVIGNQKSGTTAIAVLLAELTDASVTLDFLDGICHPLLRKVRERKIGFEHVMRWYSKEFSREIIKEPCLSPFYEELREYLPCARFVMVVRDPRQNIRSILDRHELRGDCEKLSPCEKGKLNRSWQLVFDGRWLGLDGENYVEMLAQRWQFIADVYIRNKHDLTLVRYEDFCQDKSAVVRTLAEKLRIPCEDDIAGVVDIQYQRQGDHRGISPDDFFSEANLARIRHICQPGMNELG